MENLLSSESSQEINQASQGSNFSLRGRAYNKKFIRGTIDLMTESVVETFDYLQISYRSSVSIIGVVAKSLGHDLKTLILNPTSFRLKRKAVREKKAMKIKELFGSKQFNYLEVHWDGKLMLNASTSKKEDRVPIIVTSGATEKILDIPALESGTGINQANAIYEALYKWGLIESVEVLCCDTTNSNLGCKAGAAVILEQKLDKDILYLPCRHHISEVMLAACFILIVPKSTGPNVTMFEKFKNEWSEIDSSKFQSGLAKINPLLKDKIKDIKSFIQDYLKKELPRSDYKELLELSLLFLGEKDIKIRKPGACSNARWMSKAIYCIKMYLFRKVYTLPAQESSFLAVSQFIVFVYIQHWYTCSLAVVAPYNDLKLIKKLNEYKIIDPSISKVVIKKLENHLWYLSPESSALSFFDDEVPTYVKRKMLESLREEVDPEMDPPKKFPGVNISHLVQKEMDYFINQWSKKLFDRLKLKQNFLNVDPSLWPDNSEYKENQKVLQSLQVVNDVAERAVKLADSYLNTLTKNEDQKQFLFQIVSNYKQENPNVNKKTLRKSVKEDSTNKD